MLPLDVFSLLPAPPKGGAGALPPSSSGQIDELSAAFAALLVEMTGGIGAIEEHILPVEEQIVREAEIAENSTNVTARHVGGPSHPTDVDGSLSEPDSQFVRRVSLKPDRQESGKGLVPGMVPDLWLPTVPVLPEMKLITDFADAGAQQDIDSQGAASPDLRAPSSSDDSSSGSPQANVITDVVNNIPAIPITAGSSAGPAEWTAPVNTLAASVPPVTPTLDSSADPAGRETDHLNLPPVLLVRGEQSVDATHAQTKTVSPGTAAPGSSHVPADDAPQAVASLPVPAPQESLQSGTSLVPRSAHSHNPAGHVPDAADPLLARLADTALASRAESTTDSTAMSRAAAQDVVAGRAVVVDGAGVSHGHTQDKEATSNPNTAIRKMTFREAIQLEGAEFAVPEASEPRGEGARVPSNTSPVPDLVAGTARSPVAPVVSQSQVSLPNNPGFGAAYAVAVPVESAGLDNQIVRAMRLTWQGGKGEAKVTLQPEYLGAVTISLRVERGAVIAVVHAEEPQVRAWMQTHEASLRQGLSGQGLHLERLVVSDERPDTPHRDQSDAEDRRERRSSRRWRNPGEEPRFEVAA